MLSHHGSPHLWLTAAGTMAQYRVRAPCSLAEPLLQGLPMLSHHGSPHLWLTAAGTMAQYRVRAPC
ncbi:hypothetical protein, partial [Aquitalea magnusonii]|uniref:hypothetical protein n=1 Tax=Aquitalea magnusonii TaxID=332411 RepID=UPI001956D718